MKYIEPYITSDIILQIYATTQYRQPIDRISTYFASNNLSRDYITQAYTTLEIDGYLIKESTSMYILHGSGAVLSKNGGYEQLFKDQEAELQIHKRTDSANLEMIESVKETNESVRNTNRVSSANIRRQEKLFWVTAGIALLGAIFQTLSYFNESEKRELKQSLKESGTYKQQLQILRDSLKSLPPHQSLGTDSSKKKSL